MPEANELRERDPLKGAPNKKDGPANGMATPAEDKPALDGAVMRPEDGSDDEDLGKVNLKRQVGLLSGIALIVGTMIGSGIFISPRGVLVNSNSVGMSLVIWTLCGMLAMFGALAYAELGTLVPKSGAEYVYLYETVGPIPAFLFAWTSTLILKPAQVAIIALGFGAYVVQPFFPNECEPPLLAVKLFATLSILLILFINCASVKWATAVQNFFTGAKLLALAIIFIVGFIRMCNGYVEYLDPKESFKGSSTNVFAYGLAFYQGLWAYDGWNQLNYITEELIDPHRNLPLAIIIGLPLVTISYLLVNMAYFTVMSPEELLQSGAVAVTFANRTLGNWAWIMPVFVACSTFGAANGTMFTAGSYVTQHSMAKTRAAVLEVTFAERTLGYFQYLIPIFVCMSTFGAANGTLFTAARLTYVAAREGHMVECLSMIHVKRYTPFPALVFTALLAVLMLLPSDLDTLINYFSFAAWLFYGGTTFTVIILRWQHPEWHRPIKVPIILPIIVFIASIYLVVAPIIDEPAVEFLYAALFILAGLLFYVPFVYKKYHPKFMKYITIFLQLLFECAPSHYAPE